MILIRPSDVGGTIRASPSKSYTHRAILMGFLTAGRFRVRNPLLSEDTQATIDGVEAFGGRCTVGNGELVVRGEGLALPEKAVDARNSGTTIRLLTGLAALLDGTTRLTGDASLRRRPMGPLLDALRDLGVSCSPAEDGCPPVEVAGPMKGTRAQLRGDVSSQFLSSLLIACPLKATETRIDVLPPVRSEPYVDLTIHMLREFGVAVDRLGGGYRIPGRRTYAGTSFTVPGDFSSAAFPLAAGAVAGGPVTVEGLDASRPQGDVRFLDLLRAFGATVDVRGDRVTVSGGTLLGRSIDVSQNPDLFPILAVLGACARGTTRLSGGEHLRFKESDRIATTVAFLRAMGADIEATPDGCVVRGPATLRGARIVTEGDHRIAMAAAVAALAAEGGSNIEDEGSHAVSYPTFLDDLRSLGAEVVV